MDYFTAATFSVIIFAFRLRPSRRPWLYALTAATSLLVRPSTCEPSEPLMQARRFGLKPKRLTADTAYGTGKVLAWLLGKNITPYIPVWERYERTDGMFPRAAYTYDAECNVYICTERSQGEAPTSSNGREVPG